MSANVSATPPKIINVSLPTAMMFAGAAEVEPGSARRTRPTPNDAATAAHTTRLPLIAILAAITTSAAPGVHGITRSTVTTVIGAPAVRAPAAVGVTAPTRHDQVDPQLTHTRTRIAAGTRARWISIGTCPAEGAQPRHHTRAEKPRKSIAAMSRSIGTFPEEGSWHEAGEGIERGTEIGTEIGTEKGIERGIERGIGIGIGIGIEIGTGTEIETDRMKKNENSSDRRKEGARVGARLGARD